MNHGIAQLFKPLLRLLLPASGRHRGTERAPAAPSVDTPTARLPRVPVLRGEDIGLVHPYLVAQEHQQEEGRQRARRRALVLTTYGVDTGSRWIHGVEVTA